MKIIEKIKREKMMRPILKAGFSRKMASAWYRKVKYDYKAYSSVYDKKTLKDVHRRGYLARHIKQYDLLTSKENHYISDFEYIYLSPFNNSFSKWLDDILTTNRILSKYGQFNRKVYFSIIERNFSKLIFKVGHENRPYSVDYIIELLREKKMLELRPAFWLSKKRRYKLEYIDERLHINGYLRDYKDLEQIIRKLNANYIISEYVDIYYKAINETNYDGYMKVYIANDIGKESQILAGYINLLWNENFKSKANGKNISKRKNETLSINIENGEFVFSANKYVLDNWECVKKSLLQIGEELKAISFFSMSVTLQENEFKILSFSANPTLPKIDIDESLNQYLKDKFRKKRLQNHLSTSDRVEAIKTSRFHKFVKKHCRPGIRPYMQRLWFEAIKDDLKNTKKSLKTKIWAWRKGFLSYRIDQYGLTSDNYKQFLSDYDYYWLNRINNSYQIWINDKTTFRYILEPFKEYIPQYYYSIYKCSGKTVIKPMQDCPENSKTGTGIDGIIKILKEKGKLALKPSAGTHGDGFYCLSYDKGNLYANDQIIDPEDFKNMINGFHSFYLVTEFINMNYNLKKIYDKSVNSIRIMVINKYGYDPQIMQAYMRIGSLKSGYTDNVGYGGICVMINVETGEMFNPEQIVDHKFQSCDRHPDTGVLIRGKIPNWDMMCSKLLDICRYMPELEYLGFDIAITDQGFQIIEINIHQDLHKVATHSQEIKEYFRDKIKNKKRIYKIQ